MSFASLIESWSTGKKCEDCVTAGTVRCRLFFLQINQVRIRVSESNVFWGGQPVCQKLLKKHAVHETSVKSN